MADGQKQRELYSFCTNIFNFSSSKFAVFSKAKTFLVKEFSKAARENSTRTY